MTHRLRAAALLVGAAVLSTCQAVPPALTVLGSTLAGAKAAYDIAGQVTAGASAVITTACNEWRVTRAAAQARITAGVVAPEKAQQAADTMPWLDETCDPNAPPPKDPIAGAIWLAGLAGRIAQLTKQETP